MGADEEEVSELADAGQRPRLFSGGSEHGAEFVRQTNSGSTDTQDESSQSDLKAESLQCETPRQRESLQQPGWAIDPKYLYPDETEVVEQVQQQFSTVMSKKGLPE